MALSRANLNLVPTLRCHNFKFFKRDLHVTPKIYTPSLYSFAYGLKQTLWPNKPSFSQDESKHYQIQKSSNSDSENTSSYLNSFLNQTTENSNVTNPLSFQSKFMAKIKQKAKSQYLFNEALHEEVYLGMEIFNTTNDISVLENKIQEISSDLRDFADGVNPFEVTQPELKTLNIDILDAVYSAAPAVSEVARYLLSVPGKRFRPVLGILINKIISENFQSQELNFKKGMQTKMIEVAEIIHTASMMHDDVIDDANIRRGSDSANKVFGNKKAILGGDFLLARACRISATFGIPEVCERTSNIVESLAKGELIQGSVSHNSLDADFNTYLTKTYYKTAALMAESCACGAIIGGFSSSISDFAFKLAGLVGMAFQLCDDLLDYSQSSQELGKPALNDIRSGIITSPLFLSALEDSQTLTPILNRNMSHEGDFEMVLKYIYSGSAIPRAQLLVLIYIEKALEMLKSLSSNQSNDGCTYSKALAALMLTMIKLNPK